MTGKLVSIVGCPGVGKTFLATRLSEYFDAKLILVNQPDTIPSRVRMSLERRTNLFETILWFRNQQIADHFSALDMAAGDRYVFMDSPFFQYQLFIDLYIKDVFQREILYTMGKLDILNITPPDIVVYISCTPNDIRRFLGYRRGKRSWENDDWLSLMTEMSPLADAYIKSLNGLVGNILTINRSDYDFDIKDDLLRFVQQLRLP